MKSFNIKKYIKIISIIIFPLFLFSCGNTYKIDANNSAVEADLMYISQSMMQYFAMGKKINDMGLNLSDNKPYGQKYILGTSGNDEYYQIMGFTCNEKLKKVVVLVGQYPPRKVKKYKRSKTYMNKEKSNTYFYESSDGYGDLTRGDATNLGIIKKVTIEYFPKDGLTVYSASFEKNIEKNIDYISLLKDDPLSLILDENKKPYINGQIIGDCKL